ncbi:MobP3 family relaxase [Caldanaerobacter subterraneus]|uniref:Relaxase n=1 Tax=Caldanaerobacter subterraneus TaxID=911092 RepID=A0A7Y2L9U1_9THEO|nr:MobP3 family relaxase [Caldanaerobacter subterraneus]NNG67882.1 relaxase [Caldanaerobacter subterraneus]
MTAPFVMKASFYLPTNENQAKNVAHLLYIGTRSGVDKGEFNELEELDAGNRYAEKILAEYDKLDDFIDNFEIDTAGTPAGHVKYMDERPGSHGLFSSDENVSLKETMKELSKHSGVVWRFILSLKEEDAVKLGYTTRESWEKALRATISDAAAKMGISESNLRWVAAFHQAKGHPHVHVVMWEKTPQRRLGRLSKGEVKDIKKIFLDEIYAKERLALTAEKSALRDLIRDTAKRDILEVLREVKKARIEIRALNGEKPGLPPTLDQITREELLEKLKELSKIMPSHGRIAFAYMPSEVKEKAKEIADWLLKQPGFLQSVERYKELAKELASHYTSNPEILKKAADKAYEDIQKRTAQIVLKGAAALQKDPSKVINTVWRSAWRALERERLRAEAESSIAAQKEMEKKRRMAERGESREV